MHTCWLDRGRRGHGGWSAKAKPWDRKVDDRTARSVGPLGTVRPGGLTAGHRGLVGSALHRPGRGLQPAVRLTRQLDSTDRAAMFDFAPESKAAGQRRGGPGHGIRHDTWLITSENRSRSTCWMRRRAARVPRLLFRACRICLPKPAPRSLSRKRVAFRLLLTNDAYAATSPNGILRPSARRQHGLPDTPAMPTKSPYGPGDNFFAVRLH